MADDNITTDISTAPEPPALSATSDVPVVTPDPAPPADDKPADTPAADGDPPADPPVPPAEDDPAPVDTKPDRSLSGRLSQRTRERNELRDQNDRLAGLLERALDRLGNKPAETKPAETPPPAPEPRPTREQFDDPDAYEVALLEWSGRNTARVIRQELEQQEAARRTTEQQTRDQEAQKQEQGRVIERFNGQVAELKDDPQYADFEDVVFNREVQVADGLAPLLFRAGAKVAYAVIGDQDMRDRLNKLTTPRLANGAPNPEFDPLQASFEIGGIRHRLESARPPVSRAPAPIVPTNGANRANERTLEELGNEGSMDEYAAKRMPQVQADRRPSMFGNRTH